LKLLPLFIVSGWNDDIEWRGFKDALKESDET